MDLQTETLTIDRFEDNNLAVLETATKESLVLPMHWLPEGCNEGDVLNVLRDEGTLSFTIDVEAKARASQEISNLRESLNKAPDGDIDL